MDYSIIIPVFNGGKTLGKCIEAILNSDFNKKFEIIVVDDKSTDNSVEVAKRFKTKVIRCEVNSGPSKARNIGAKIAKGDVLIFIDADVMVFPDTLKKVEVFFKENRDFSGISAIFHPHFRIKSHLSRYKNLYMHKLYAHSPKSVNWLFTSFFAVKRGVFEKIEFDSKIRYVEDLQLASKIVNAGYKLGFDKNLLIEHLHVYNLKRFIKEEFNRSRNVILLKLSNYLHRKKKKNNKYPFYIVFSIWFFPFILIGILLSWINILFAVVPLLIFYLVNLSYLVYLKKNYGLFFAFVSSFIIMLDSFMCELGIGFGILDFIMGKRM